MGLDARHDGVLGRTFTKVTSLAVSMSLILTGVPVRAIAEADDVDSATLVSSVDNAVDNSIALPEEPNVAGDYSSSTVLTLGASASALLLVYVALVLRRRRRK